MTRITILFVTALLGIWPCMVPAAHAQEYFLFEKVVASSLRQARKQGINSGSIQVTAESIRELWPAERNGRVVLLKSNSPGLAPWHLFLIRGRLPENTHLLLPAELRPGVIADHLVGFGDENGPVRKEILERHSEPVQPLDPGLYEKRLADAQWLTPTGGDAELLQTRLMSKLYRESKGMDGFVLQRAIPRPDRTALLVLTGPDLGPGSWLALVHWFPGRQVKALLLMQEYPRNPAAVRFYYDPNSESLLVRSEVETLAGIFDTQKIPNPLSALYREFRPVDGIYRPADGLSQGGLHEMERLFRRVQDTIGEDGQWTLNQVEERRELSSFHFSLHFEFKGQKKSATARISLLYDLVSGSLSRLN